LSCDHKERFKTKIKSIKDYLILKFKVMKRLFFTLAIMVSLTSVVSAQTVGQFWGGGSIGITSSKEKDGLRLTNYNIMPEAGYQVTDYLGIGVKLGYYHDENNEGGVKEKINGFKINPFARYSFLQGNIGKLFVDGGVGYEYAKNKLADAKIHELEVGFRPGVAINVSNRVALTGHYGFIGYQYEKYGNKKTNTFSFDFDMSQVQFGVNIIF